MPEITVADSEYSEKTRESFAATRYRADRDVYTVPSYDKSGAQIEIPITSLSSEKRPRTARKQECSTGLRKHRRKSST